MREQEVELVSGLVQRYCAIDNASEEGDPADGTPERVGRFCFYQGKSRRQAMMKQVRAPVAWGELGRTTAEVLRRTRELATNGEGHVWVAAFAEGDTNPRDVVKVAGTVEEEDNEASGGDAIAALTAALVTTNRMLRDDNSDLRGRLDRYYQGSIETAEQMALLVTHNRLLEDSHADETMTAAIEAFAPTAEKLVPVLLAWFSGGGGLPEDPAERVREGVRRTMASIQDVSVTLAAHPEVQQVPGIVDPLVDLVVQLAPRLGFRIERVTAESPPPPKGRRKKTDQPAEGA